MLETFTVHTFRPHLNDTFHVFPDAATDIPMTLITVTALGEGGTDTEPAQGRHPFSLVFRSAPGVPLPQRIYTLEHAELGRFELFLVPIAADREGVRYEAIFT